MRYGYLSVLTAAISDLSGCGWPLLRRSELSYQPPRLRWSIQRRHSHPTQSAFVIPNEIGYIAEDNVVMGIVHQRRTAGVPAQHRLVESVRS